MAIDFLSRVLNFDKCATICFEFLRGKFPFLAAAGGVVTENRQNILKSVPNRSFFIQNAPFIVCV
jgi:hypothetical protein